MLLRGDSLDLAPWASQGRAGFNGPEWPKADLPTSWPVLTQEPQGQKFHHEGHIPLLNFLLLISSGEAACCAGKTEGFTARDLTLNPASSRLPSCMDFAGHSVTLQLFCLSCVKGDGREVSAQ